MTVRELLQRLGVEEWSVNELDIPTERLNYRIFLPDEREAFDVLVNDLYSEVNIIG
ncbi:MAG: hypothetical protein KGL39_29850 [Patescibacteria group bacterium]|nr:hypothetical protein [Patescibacteria group bacterium]